MVSIEQDKSSRFTHWTCEFSTMYSWPNLQYQACISLYGVGLKSNQKTVGYSITFVPLLYMWASLVTLVINAVYNIHSW